MKNLNKKAQKVKIVSGWSSHGGSTVAFVRLCNALNATKEYNCTFYGPHDWHLHQCQADHLQNFSPESDDIVLCHFLDIKERLPVKKQYLVMHEKSGYLVGDKYKCHDKVVFLHEPHREWHKTPKENSLIIPNFFEEFTRKDPGISRGDIAGIIGSVEPRKNTHIAIKRALSKGHKKIFLFGTILDKAYYAKAVQPFLDAHPDIIEHKGFVENKQAMYDSVDIVYHWAVEEIACFVLGECELQGIPCDFGAGTEPYKVFENDIVLEKWKAVL
tara:strand:- start:142 stop:957 length:816 start_codon:yes stop_codon:yes gene_type:complete